MPPSTAALVSIIGAGPGNPDLLTVKALRRLQEAEAVIYDRLIGPGILDLAPAGAIRIFAGKSCKQHHMPQEEINRLLITLARKGRRVVRLKGGDPFIFGRGGEEALALAEANIPFEVIPGISAASGCAAYAGIPLTHRGLASSVHFLTGHRMKEEGPATSLPHSALHNNQAQGTRHKAPTANFQLPTANSDDTTLVAYMGLANLHALTADLIATGWPAETPAAAIQNGTTQDQRVLVSNLLEIAKTLEEENFAPPTLIIIGRVVSLAEKLQWFMSQNIETKAWKKYL